MSSHHVHCARKRGTRTPKSKAPSDTSKVLDGEWAERGQNPRLSLVTKIQPCGHFSDKPHLTQFEQLSDSSVESATSPSFEFALSTNAGCDCVAHFIRSLTAANATPTILSIDGVGVFDLILRATSCSKVVSRWRRGQILFFVRGGTRWASFTMSHRERLESKATL